MCMREKKYGKRIFCIPTSRVNIYASFMHAEKYGNSIQMQKC